MNYLFVHNLRRSLFVLTLTLCAISCARQLEPLLPVDGWVRVKKANFSIAMPDSFVEKEAQGMDTTVYRFESPDLSKLTCEYGIYAGVPENISREENFKESRVWINGKSARLMSYTTNQTGRNPSKMIVLVFQHVNFSSNNLVFWGEYNRDEYRDVMLTILSTVSLS